MLHIVYASCPQAKEKFFLANKSQEDLWLVSHIEAKRTLQNFFLETQTTIFNKSVLRASEYWQWLFSVNCPDWRAVSESLVFALLEQWFDEAEVDVRYCNLEMFRHFFGQALPLMVAENGPLLEDWLTADSERDERLAGWFDQAKAFWEFLREKKWIGRNWAVNVLNDRDTLYLGEFKRYFVDLGLELRQEEVEMILRISKEKEVTVVIPRTGWCENYEPSLRVYKKIIEASQQETELPQQATPVIPELQEYSSVLKESKAVVSQVRALLETGVAASQIAVLSSNIEDYWDMLREHFLVEGIPVNKKYVLRAISLPVVQAWLARLNLARTDFEQAHVETFLFSDLEAAPVDGAYMNFKKEFSHIYDTDEARSYLKLPEQYKKTVPLTLTEFVEFIMNTWRGENREVADEIVDLMAQELRPSDTFSYELWLKYLELVVSRYEVQVRTADQEGVLLTNFNQADWAAIDYAFVLGCEQSRLREITATPISAQDIARIELDLGFYLQRSESLKKEFELRWFCDKSLKALNLSHSHSDFDGGPQLAASLWLELENLHKSVKTSSPASPTLSTRWDLVMASELTQIQQELMQSSSESDVQKNKLNLEFGFEAYGPVPITSDVSLSAGSLKKYFECPFLFYVEKVLKMKDQNEYDLDVDPMFQGQIWHKMVELIHKQYPSLEINREQLSELYDEAALELDITSPLKKFWLQEKNRHLLFIKNFLELEKDWREKFTSTQTIATESGVKGYLGIEDGKVRFSSEKINDSFHVFNGRIDRIDRDSKGHLSVIDYKSSSNDLKSFKNWPKNGLFQMPLYALALEAGLADDVPSSPVVAASYFIFKDKERGMGYILDNNNHEFGDLKEKSKQLASEETRDEVFNEILEKIKDIFARMRLGFFKPEPRDTKTCERCQWSRVCRAPHLK